jgi:hypothetical protein
MSTTESAMQDARETAPLKAWCCKDLGEVVAARTAAEAREVLLASGANGLAPGDYDAHAEDLADACWKALPDERRLLDEDGEPMKQTVGEAVAALGKPGYLWSFEV